MLKTPNRKPVGRLLVWGLILLAATAATGAAWYWNQRVHAADPGVVIRTEAEAIQGARKFLIAARVGTSGYDLSQASGVTRDRLKGQIVWRVVWGPRAEAALTNQLAVLAEERGWFSVKEMSSTDEGIAIQGDLTNITREYFKLGGPKAD